MLGSLFADNVHLSVLATAQIKMLMSYTIATVLQRTITISYLYGSNKNTYSEFYHLYINLIVFKYYEK